MSRKNKYVLNTHLTKSKKCLESRGLTLSKKFICKGCENLFSNNTNLTVHIESCKEYSIFMIRCEYEEKIVKLQKEMSDTISELKDVQLKERQMFEKEKLFLEKQLETFLKWQKNQ